MSRSEKQPLLPVSQPYPGVLSRKQSKDMSVSKAGAPNELLVEREQEGVDNSPSALVDNDDRDQGPAWWPFNKPKPKIPAPAGPPSKLRKVPVKVEPKVFFSNERTFIAWMNMAVTLSTIAIAILAFADHNPWSEVYGLMILPVAIAFVVYALMQYMRRARLIRQRAPGPYEDLLGPTLLATMLMVAIVMNFAIKIYAMYG